MLQVCNSVPHRLCMSIGFTAMLTGMVIMFAGPAANAQQIADASVAEPPTFQLNELRVLGNSVLAPISIQKLLSSYLGPERTLQDVESARAVLENEYHAQGYGTVYVDIPEQTVAADGIVRLHVTESRLRHPAITGTRYFSNRQIRTALPQAADNIVPNLPKLQAEINAVNAVTADRQVAPVLKAGPSPGTVDLALKVQDRLPLHLVAEVNNQYTADTTKLRASLALSYDNAFARQDSLSLQYQTAPQDTREVAVFAASYVARLSDSQNRLSLAYVDSSSRVATIGDILVRGKGKNYNLDLIRSLQASSSVLAAATVGLHYKQSVQGVSLSANESLETPVTYTLLQASYNVSLFGEQRIWSFAPSLSFGLPGLGASRAESADKCYGCKPNFSVVRVDSGVRQKLPLGLSLSLQASGQYSVDPLVSNEQFLLGGIHSVRGYLEAEELGDIGIRGSVELHATKLVPVLWGLSIDPYVFYDAGRVSYQQPSPGQGRSSALQSTGLGIDLQGWKHFNSTLVLGKPLVDGNYTERGETRLHFLVRGTW
jgi:hemolysin activation/secretion protein